MVGEVEAFRAELHRVVFADREPARQRQVDVGDALSAKRGSTTPSLPNPNEEGAVKQAVLKNLPLLYRSPTEPGRFLSQPATTFGRMVPAPKVEFRTFVPVYVIDSG